MYAFAHLGTSVPMEKKYFTTIKPEAGPAIGLELEPLMNESDPIDFESAMHQNLVNEGKHGTVHNLKCIG
jgi:hypothetical protein